MVTTLLTGFGMSTVPSLTPGTAEVGAITGSTHGGQPSIVGAHVYLYQSVSTGYGNAAKSLLTAAANTTSDGMNYYATTDSSGGFSLSGDYTCTSGSQLYVYVTGGNAGGGANSAIGLMAALGQCPSIGTLATQVPYVWVSEVTTVSTAYALAGFMSTPTQLSIANTDLARTGLANAMGTATNMVGVANGVASATTLASGSNGTVQQAKINTLANILASCVNTSGPSSSGCNTLLTTATADGTSSGTQPTNTAQAILNIAHHPGSNVAALYAIPAPQQAFAPALTTQPNDWLLKITFTGTSSSTAGVVSIAIDSAGNAWTVDTVNLGMVSPLGRGKRCLCTCQCVHIVPVAVAVAPGGSVWFSDTRNSAIDIYSGSGAPVSSSADTAYPFGLAFSSNGNGYAANNNGYGTNTLTILTSSGAFSSQLYSNFGNIAYPTVVALDSSNNAWLNSVFNYVGKVPPGATTTSSTVTGSATAASYRVLPSAQYSTSGLAIDAADTVWVVSNNYNALFSVTDAGVAGGGYTGGGLSYPAAVAIDGAGQVWVANGRPSISEFSNTGTALSPASTGFGTSTTSGVATQAIAVDGSGNVWIGSSGGNASVPPVMEFVGAAVPVATPILPYHNGVRP